MHKFIVSLIKENLLLSYIFLLSIVTYLTFEILTYYYNVKNKFHINCLELTLLLNHKNAIIIDIRSEEEFRLGHIINSINIPALDFNPQHKIIKDNANSTLIIVDSNGKANLYANMLRNSGRSEVWFLKGGLLEWQKNEMPLVATKTKATITNTITKYKDIILYTKKDCPYCLGAKNLLKNLNYNYYDIEIKDLESKEYHEMLALSGGIKTFPQIFIKNKHIGGFKELKDLNDKGELDKILNNF